MTRFINLHIRLAVAHEVEAKGANQATSEIGQALNLRCLIFGEDVANAVQRVLLLIFHCCTTDYFRIAISYF